MAKQVDKAPAARPARPANKGVRAKYGRPDSALLAGGAPWANDKPTQGGARYNLPVDNARPDDIPGGSR
jgi:hypothetical protein